MDRQTESNGKTDRQSVLKTDRQRVRGKTDERKDGQ